MFLANAPKTFRGVCLSLRIEPAMAFDDSWQIEGRAKFKVGNAFYRPHSRVVRDLGVLAAAVYRHEVGSLSVLDAMAGCGVRSLRYLLESGADWVHSNEGNPQLQDVLTSNLQAAIASRTCRVTYQNANRLFFECYNQQEFYDLVDVDNFGSPVPYLATVLWATKIGGLVYLTSTDGRTVTGNLPEKSLRVYGAYARSHPSAHEQGLRLLLGSIQKQAATQEFGIEPIFSLFTGQTYRVMVRFLPKVALTASNYGFLGYCRECGNYQTIVWKQLGKAKCRCDRAPLTLSGPLWLGKLHSRPWLEKMQALAQEWNWQKRFSLLEIMHAEAELPPYFYTLKAIGHRGKMDIPKRDRLICALQNRGYLASSTHVNPQAIKTDASLETCIEIARSC